MKKQLDHKILLLHIFALNGFAVVQPVLDLLGNNADFFVARGSQVADLLALLLVLLFGLPLILAGVYKALSKVSVHALQICHYSMVAFLVGITFLPVLKNFDLPDIFLVPVAIGIGVLFAISYRKYRGVSLFVTALSPVTLVFVIVFLHGSTIQELGRTAEPVQISESTLKTSDIPVVVLIFDEFALTALMGADRSIDETLFPNFQRLAEDASWYRNATTVATSTMLSVPAMLSGNYPREFVSQSYLNYPDTLFTLLADSHRMNVYESTTSLCSPDLCTSGSKLSKTGLARIKFLLADVSAIYLHIITPDVLGSRLPVVNMTWENYWQLDEAASWQRHNYGGRLEQLEYFINSITKQTPPGLHLIHTNFPHLPYQYLPTGNRYQGEWQIPGLDFATDHWGENRWLITQAYQRFLLQVATADLVIGKLIDHLQSIGIYDESLIVVVADHGVSFYPDSQRRDAPPLDVLDKDVLPVPLFIKYPHQSSGKVSDENVETIDILPTILDVLGAGMGLDMDGRSLAGDQPPRPQKLAFHAYKDFLSYNSDPSGEAKYETLEWKLDNFEASSGVNGLFSIGNHPGLIGRQLSNIPFREALGIDIVMDIPELYAEVRTDSGFIPSQVSGTMQSTGPIMGPDVAIAVNGIVRAVTEMYPVAENYYKFSAMVPEQSFKNGVNEVSAFLVSPASNGEIKLLAARDQPTTGTETPDLENPVLSEGTILGRTTETPIVTGKLKGQLEYARIDGGTVEFFGWAIDIAGKEPVEKILIFEDGRYVYSNSTGMPRGEGALYEASDVILVGFQFILPLNLFQAPGRSEVRLFAISRHGYATELEYFEDYALIGHSE